MFEILSAGLFSTIQDMGRYGYRSMGVPSSGVMDQYSARLANALLDNDENCAMIECTFTGPTIKFHCDTYIAITGAACQPTLNGELIKTHRVIQVESDSILKLGSIRNGVRTYLAFAGGIDSPVLMNSRSFYAGITLTSKLNKGDIFNLNLKIKDIKNRATVKINNTHFTENRIQVSAGPEFDLLNNQMKQKLLAGSYKISTKSNRMAYKLEQSNTVLKAQEIITSGVQAGTVQLMPSGELIVLMRDCQSTGGYARVLQLTDQAINQLAQKAAGQSISLTCIIL